MIAGIVLAAGRSSRLGRPKQLLPVLGEPLLRHTVHRVLASSLDNVVLVVGHNADAIRDAVAGLSLDVVFNPDAALGQSTSVRAGLAALSPDNDAAIFILGDQPGIDPNVIDALISAWRESQAPILAPHYEDGMGNPVLFDRRVFPELAALQGDTGARPVVQAYHASGDLQLVPVAGPAPPDVDTEDDYAALVAAMSSQPAGRPPRPQAPRRLTREETNASAPPKSEKSPSPIETGEGVG
ncbi:MAG: nucleotidyltransferase family protein [Chloroflexi bacterium]|nr:nucleotidyltransferase family protein [Chloroflexota bacterium]